MHERKNILTYFLVSRGSRGGCCAPYTGWMLKARKKKEDTSCQEGRYIGWVPPASQRWKGLRETGDLQEQLCPSQRTATYSLKKKKFIIFPGEVSAPYAIIRKSYPDRQHGKAYSWTEYSSNAGCGIHYKLSLNGLTTLNMLSYL